MATHSSILAWRITWTVATRLLFPWNSGKNTGVGSHSLLQGIFLIEGLNPGLPHCQQILYQLSHQGSLSMCRETLNQALHVKSANVSEGCFTVKAILPMVL